MASEWIATQIKQASFSGDGAVDALKRIEDLHSKRLWHQLTGELETFLSLPEWQSGDYLIQMFKNFTSTFQDKLKPLKLSQIAITTSKQFTDNETALVFLESLLPAVDDKPQANVLLQSEIGSLHLKQGEMKKVKQMIEQNKEILDNLTGVESQVNSSFYILSATYHKQNENAEGYYADMLSYLSHIQANLLSQAQKQAIAYDLAIASLVGASVFNFTELLDHPVFLSLQESEHNWLISVVRSFNAGDIEGYKKILVDNRSQFNGLPIFVNNETFLLEKITILALMCYVFQLSSDERTLSFENVARVTSLPENQVEFLLMKALSLKLIRGVIDEIDRTVAVTWVQPRALGMQQISTLKDKLSKWQIKVEQIQTQMHSESPELLAN